jgi:glycosyltransferase involved in cell wall biosynthesis
VRIGVVIPAYNAAAWISDAIASLLAQSHRDWLLVVVDDGSADATAAVVGTFTDPRIRLIRQKNAGVSSARNRGVAELLGSFLPLPSREGGGGRGHAILFLDADDWLAPDALSRLAAALDAAPTMVAAGGAYTFVGTGTVRTPPSGDILQRLLVRNLFANGGHLLIRSEAIRAAGAFLPALAYGEDWEFWIRIALQGRFAATPGRAPVLLIRQHPGSAYHRLATDPAAFVPCMDAIFANPVLLAHFGARHLATIRRRTGAENDWVIGRELVRHGHKLEGLVRLHRSVRAHPSVKRACLLAIAHMLPLVPSAWRGPFCPYQFTSQAARTRTNFACSVPTSPCGRKMMNTTSRLP